MELGMRYFFKKDTHCRSSVAIRSAHEMIPRSISIDPLKSIDHSIGCEQIFILTTPHVNKPRS